MDSNTLFFYATSDVVVVGQHPEMADIDNPRGDLHGFASYVIAEDCDGFRRCTPVKTARWEDTAMAPAYKLAEALGARQEAGKLPGFWNVERVWRDHRPAYGSQAYIWRNQADLDARQEREDDAAC